MVIFNPCLGLSQLLWHQAGSRELPWAGCGWDVGCCPLTAQLHQHLALTALSSAPGSCGAVVAALDPFSWEDGCAQAVQAAALEELHPAGRLALRRGGF